MAARTTRPRANATPANLANAKVSGAIPYQPKMSKTAYRKAVVGQLGQRIKLADFRPTVTPLTANERDILVGQALEVLEKTYAHLPLKRALHANDPIQSLKLLMLRHSGLDERAFQSAMIDTFVGLRDLHTNYILPTEYSDKFAFLPFRVEEFYAPGGVSSGATSDNQQQRKYVVSWVSPVNTVASLKEGVVVTHWNGSPIDLAVARNGAREAGSNLDARRAQGIEALTLRWLGMSLPPDEDWVVLTYADSGQTHESRFDWEIIDGSDVRTALAGLPSASAAAIGLDLKRLLLDKLRKLVFDPSAVQVEDEAVKHRGKGSAKARATPPRADTSLFPEVFPRFGEVTTPSGKFGYIRLKSFAPESPADDVVEKTVEEFARILATMPSTGLILDVRGNGGGYVNIGELILQLLTPHPITPEGFQFLATPTTLALAKASANGLKEWARTILEGLESGASFSQGLPLTDPVECNALGQIYQGPVVLVTDALCYSTTDIFAAGFQDHGIGLILGCHSSTGAGGANVWEYVDLRNSVIKPVNPFVRLPRGADMRVAIRRCTRVGELAGTPVEDYGVAPDQRYYLTIGDVVGNNEDLIAAAAKILKSLPTQSLRLTPVAANPRKEFMLDTSNVDRVDLFVKGRPVISVDPSASSMSVTLPKTVPTGSTVSAHGFRGGKLVVSTRLTV